MQSRDKRALTRVVKTVSLKLCVTHTLSTVINCVSHLKLHQSLMPSFLYSYLDDDDFEYFDILARFLISITSFFVSP